MPLVFVQQLLQNFDLDFLRELTEHDSFRQPIKELGAQHLTSLLECEGFHPGVMGRLHRLPARCSNVGCQHEVTVADRYPGAVCICDLAFVQQRNENVYDPSMSFLYLVE